MLNDILKILFIGLLLSFIACNSDNKIVDNIQTRQASTVNKNEVELHPNEGLVYYKDKPFSGTSVAYYDSLTLAESIDYLKGKKHGFKTKWFPSGIKSFEAKYKEGKQDEITKSWWKNGQLRSESNFRIGKVNGVQTQWYKSGVKFKERHIVEGREEGMQRAWRENGTIYNNYEAKNGRIFGLKRASLCYELEDEEVQYKND